MRLIGKCVIPLVTALLLVPIMGSAAQFDREWRGGPELRTVIAKSGFSSLSQRSWCVEILRNMEPRNGNRQRVDGRDGQEWWSHYTERRRLSKNRKGRGPLGRRRSMGNSRESGFTGSGGILARPGSSGAIAPPICRESSHQRVVLWRQ